MLLFYNSFGCGKKRGLLHSAVVKNIVRDQIEVHGAPRGMALAHLARGLLDALRAGGFIEKRSCIVVSISCVNAARMSELNFKYRRKRGPTDVLSFEQEDAPAALNLRGVRFLGDLVLCIPVLRAQARKVGHGVRTEAVVLLAHGLLHLLGYDHEKSSAEDVRMQKAEILLLKLAGLSSSGLIGRGRVEELP